MQSILYPTNPLPQGIPQPFGVPQAGGQVLPLLLSQLSQPLSALGAQQAISPSLLGQPLPLPQAAYQPQPSVAGILPLLATALPSMLSPLGLAGIPAPRVQPIAPPWVPNYSYIVGNLVSYDGRDYLCIRPNLSRPDLPPPNAPSLWLPLVIPPYTLMARVASPLGCISVLGPLDVCYSVKENEIDLSAQLAGVTIGQCNLTLTNPQCSVGGSIGPITAQVTFAFDFSTDVLQITAQVCFPFIGCKTGHISIHI